MHHPDHDASPLNPLPPVLIGLAAVMGLIEIAFQLGARGLVGGAQAVGWRLEAAQAFGFVDALWQQALTTQSWPLDTVQRFFTYLFIHQNATHAIFAIVLLVAIGNYSSKVFSGLAMGIVFVLSGIAGAISHGVFMETRWALLGAYPAVYGFLGLMTWTLWIVAKREGTNPALAFRLVGILVALQL
ncbi:MAG: rhomboid family intramembrane serine protease, partial [Pseudomonadota bacterium]